MDDFTNNLTRPAIVAIILAALPLAFGWYQSRDKARLDERVSYYRDLRAELDELRAWRDSFDGYLVELETHIIELHAIMRAAGLTPPPRPSRPHRT